MVVDGLLLVVVTLAVVVAAVVILAVVVVVVVGPSLPWLVQTSLVLVVPMRVRLDCKTAMELELHNW